jgi:peroxiredoxin Q/BCP
VAAVLKLESKKAPAFKLADPHGETHALSDCAGQDVVLYFYPRDDSPGCTKEARGFRDLRKALLC